MDTELKRKEKIIQLNSLLESMVAIEEYSLCIQIRNLIERLEKERVESVHLNDTPPKTQNRYRI